jgi:hypothetical protein
VTFADALEACRRADEIAASEPHSDGIEVWLVPQDPGEAARPVYHALPPG